MSKRFFDDVRRESGAVLVTAGNLIAAVLAGIFWFVIAAIISVSDFGEVNYYISVAAFASGLARVGMHTTLTTFLAKGNKELASQANFLVLIISVAAGGILFIFDTLVGILVISDSVYAMAASVLLGSRKYKEFFMVVVLARALQITFAILFVSTLGVNAILISYILANFVLGYRFYSTISFSFDFSEIKKKATFVMNNLGTSVAGLLPYYSDRLIIGQLFDFERLGYYQFALQFFLFLSILPTSIAQYVLPEESRGASKRRYLLLSLIIASGIAAIIFFASDSIIDTYFPQYMVAIGAVKIISLGAIPASVTSVSGAMLIARENTRPVLIGSIMYLTALFSMMVFLGSSYGLLGLSISFLTSQCLQALFLIIVFYRYENKRLMT